MGDRNTVCPLPYCIRFQKERIAFDQIRMWEEKEEDGFKGRRRNKYFTRTIHVMIVVLFVVIVFD